MTNCGYSNFIFTQLKIDATLKHLLSLPIYQTHRMVSLPMGDKFYVFKKELMNIEVGDELNLDLSKYESILVDDVKVYYDRELFNSIEIFELKTFRFI